MECLDGSNLQIARSMKLGIKGDGASTNSISTFIGKEMRRERFV